MKLMMNERESKLEWNFEGEIVKRVELKFLREIDDRKNVSCRMKKWLDKVLEEQLEVRDGWGCGRGGGGCDVHTHTYKKVTSTNQSTQVKIDFLSRGENP
jgi:hypothetical protein